MAKFITVVRKRTSREVMINVEHITHVTVSDGSTKIYLSSSGGDGPTVIGTEEEYENVTQKILSVTK